MKNFLKAFKLAPWSVIKYPAWFLVAVISILIAYINSPLIAAYSVIKGVKNVGGFWGQLYTHDASLDGGIEQNIEGFEATAKGFKLFWQRTVWICRNPAYRFRAEKLGAGKEAVFIWKEGEGLSPPNFWYVMETPDGKRYFGHRADYHYKKGKYIKHWIGWTPGRHGHGEYFMLKNHLFSFKSDD
jgi:hypothetical protein